MATPMLLIRFGILLVMVASIMSCGWSPHLSFSSPRKTYRLELASPSLMRNSDLRIDLVAGNGTRYTIYRAGREMPMDFAYAYWGPEEQNVAFVGCSGESSVQLAYDLKNHEPMDFEKVANDVREALLRDYPKPTGPDAALDPLAAACVAIQWQEEFVRRYGLTPRT